MNFFSKSCVPNSSKFGTKTGNPEKFEPILLKKYTEKFENELFTPPIFHYIDHKTNNDTSSYSLLRGDCYGNLFKWNFDELNSCTEKKWDYSLKRFWEENLEKDDEDVILYIMLKNSIEF